MATDFIFDGQYASDYGVIIGFVGGSNNDIVSGGTIERSVAKPPNSDIFTFYGSQRNEVLVWNFSIVKDFCKTDDIYFNNEEIRQINRWLKRTDGFKWFNFCKDNEENIYYKVYIDVTPQLLNGQTVAFDLTVTSNCSYGFSEIITRKFTVNNTTPYKVIVNNDANDYILPYFKITKIRGTGDFYLNNENDLEQNEDNNKQTSFYNIAQSQEIIMDSENDIILGIDSDQFNWYFLRLVDGINMISTNSLSGINVEMLYRETREVAI